MFFAVILSDLLKGVTTTVFFLPEFPFAAARDGGVFFSSRSDLRLPAIGVLGTIFLDNVSLADLVIGTIFTTTLSRTKYSLSVSL